MAFAGTSRERERQRKERPHGRKDNCRAPDEQSELQKLGQSDQVQTPLWAGWSIGTA
jgi:cell division protein FtsN